VGGFFQWATYNADPIRGANGDMGENNIAAFDPIFFFHHCFVDYAFWQWQVRHQQTSAITIKPGVDPSAEAIRRWQLGLCMT
jgi:tyrosinase